MPALGSGDDVFGIGVPGEGLGLLIVVVDEAVDGGLEVDQGVEGTAAGGGSVVAKRGLDCVEPGAGGWREGEDVARLMSKLSAYPWNACGWINLAGSTPGADVAPCTDRGRELHRGAVARSLPDRKSAATIRTSQLRLWNFRLRAARCAPTSAPSTSTAICGTIRFKLLKDRRPGPQKACAA